MRPRRLRLLSLTIMTALACVGASSAAQARFFAAVGAGSFTPWDGSTGPGFAIQLGGGPRSGRFRFGGEFEFRRFETKVFKIPDVDKV